jgi:hypothetical protein
LCFKGLTIYLQGKKKERKKKSSLSTECFKIFTPGKNKEASLFDLHCRRTRTVPEEYKEFEYPTQILRLGLKNLRGAGIAQSE